MNSSFTPKFRLDDDVVVITGGTGAIGLATAKAVANLGATVVLIHRGDINRATQALSELPGTQHRAYQASVTESQQLSKVAQKIQTELGGATILINCAGFTQPVPAADLNALTDNLIDDIFIANWRGTFAPIRAFALQLKASGDGLIINLSSIAASSGLGSNLAYAASKAGIDALTKGLAKTLAPDIRVMAVAPGIVDTQFVSGRDESFNHTVGPSIPLQRVGTAEDVAAAITACCTSLRYATGTILIADGGRHL